MRQFWKVTAAIGIAGCFVIAGLTGLYSQTFTNPVTVLYLTSSTGQPIGVSPQNPLPVTASISTSVGGFAPSLSYATCTSAGTACTSTALPTNTGSIILFNTGTTTVSCTLAAGAATATAGMLQIPASSGLPLATVYGVTTYDHYSCIDQTGSTSNVVLASGGTGLPTGWGGGGSGGGGGAATIADGADVAEGATTDAASTQGGTGTVSAKLRLITTQLNTLNTTAGAAIVGLSGSAQSSSNPMGYVNINQTTPGTTNGVDPTTAASWGIGAPAATAPAKGVYQGGRAATTHPTAVTDGQLVAAQRDSVGKSVTSPYAIRESYVRGSASSTSNTAVDLIAAAGASLKNYITSVQCGRSDAGTTAITVALNDDTPTTLETIVLPNNGGGGGNNIVFPVPLVTAANKKFQFTPGTSTTTVYCSAQGYTGY